MRETVRKPKHGSDEWLMLRHRDRDGFAIVAASEAAAVHGEHKYISKYGLAVAKMADLPVAAEANRAMDRGNRLEPVLLSWLGDELGIQLSEPKVMYAMYEHGLIATLDGIDTGSCLSDATSPVVVAEIKTFNREWRGQLPRHWYWQGVQQAICAGVNQIAWGVFDSTLDLHVHLQDVSDDEKLEHIYAVRSFLEMVHANEIPAEWPASYDEISSMYPTSNGDTVDVTEHASVFERLREVQATKKLLAEEEELLKVTVGQVLGTNEIGTVNGNQVVSWKPQSRKSFDSKRFQAEHKDLYDQYQTSSSFRVMRFKGEK